MSGGGSRRRDIPARDEGFLRRRVREALRVFLEEVGRIDREAGGAPTRGGSYQGAREAGNVLVLRLAFLLVAEEEGLVPLLPIPLGPGRGVVGLLAEPEPGRRLPPRGAAVGSKLFTWLLELFRTVHRGSPGPQGPLLAHGGVLFDPDRFPLLSDGQGEGPGCPTTVRALPLQDGVVLRILRLLGEAMSGKRGADSDPAGGSTGPPAERFGRVYEALLEAGEVGARGAHYTPSWLANLVVRRALEPLLRDYDGASAGGDGPHTPRGILSLRVCDPAMGTGIFLLHTLRYLTTHLAKAAQVSSLDSDAPSVPPDPADLPQIPPIPHGPPEFPLVPLSSSEVRLVAARCLHGMDTDPLAVEVAKLSLWLETRSRGRPFTFLDDALRCIDGLADEEMAPSKGTTDWRGFDAVVGNPPWASFSGRQRRAPPTSRGTRASSAFGPLRGWSTLHSLFVERCLDLAAEGGRVGLLLPARVCDLAGYAPLRALVRSRGEPEEPLPYFGERAFRGVTQPCCCLLLTRRAAGPSGDGGPFALDNSARASWVRGAWGVSHAPRPTLHAPRTHDALLDRLSRCPRAPKAAFGDPGVHTGNCRDRLVRAGDWGEGAPLRAGRDLAPYRLLPPSHRVLLDVGRQPGDYFRIRPWERYLAARVLLRQTARRPVAAFHDPPAYFLNSALACYGLEGVEDEMVVAWLNSSVVAWYHLQRVPEAGQRAFPQLKVHHLRDLPVPVWPAAGSDLLALAAQVAREGRADLEPELDRRISALFGVERDLHEEIRQEVLARP